MSAEATAYVWKHSPYEGVAFTIHLAIADVVNDMHDNVFWSHAGTVAEKARTTRQSVSKWMNEMVHDGYLEALDLGSIDKRKASHQGRRVRFLMPIEEDAVPFFDSNETHAATNPDVGSLDIGAANLADVNSGDIAMSTELTSDVNSGDILGTKTKNSRRTKTSLSAKADVCYPNFDDPTVLEGIKGKGITAMARAVMEAWIQALGKNPKQVRMSQDKKSAVAARLNEGYTLAELILAVQGVALSSWHMGDNDRGTAYNDMVFVLRSGKNVEKFRDLAIAGGEKKPGSVVSQVMDMLREQERFEQEQRQGQYADAIPAIMALEGGE